MRIIRCIIAILASLHTFLPQGSAQGIPDTLTLSQAVNLALQSSLTRDEATLNLDLAELDLKIFRASLLPQVSATANFPNFTKTSSEIQQPDGSISFRPVNNNNSSISLNVEQAIPLTGSSVFLRSNLQRFDDFEARVSSYNGVPIRVGLSQPIFGFNKLKWRKQILTVQTLEAKQQYQLDMENVRLEITRLFSDLLIAQTDLQIARSNARSNQRSFAIAQQRFELGKISAADKMQLRYGLVSAQRDQQRAFQAVQDASAALLTYLGTDDDGRILGVRIPAVRDSIYVDYELARSQALDNRPERNTYQRLLLEAKRDLEEARRTGGVTVDLFASFGYTRAAQDLEQIYQTPQQEAFVQLQLNVPILDWRQRKMRTERAVAQRDYTERFVQQDRRLFESTIRQIVREFNTAQRDLEMATELRDISNERFRIAQESFVYGALSITDLTIAQREKDQAARIYVHTLTRYWENYYQLRRVTLYDFKTNQKIVN